LLEPKIKVDLFLLIGEKKMFCLKAATTNKWLSFVEDHFLDAKRVNGGKKTGSKCLRLLRGEQKALICGKGAFLHHHELKMVHSACVRKILLLTSFQTE
jgi:hypothetical protein